MNTPYGWTFDGSSAAIFTGDNAEMLAKNQARVMGKQAFALYTEPQPVIAHEWVMLTDAEVGVAQEAAYVALVSKGYSGSMNNQWDKVFGHAIQAAFIAKQGAKT